VRRCGVDLVEHLHAAVEQRLLGTLAFDKPIATKIFDEPSDFGLLRKVAPRIGRATRGVVGPGDGCQREPRSYAHELPKIVLTLTHDSLLPVGNQIVVDSVGRHAWLPALFSILRELKEEASSSNRHFWQKWRDWPGFSASARLAGPFRVADAPALGCGVSGY
jgi:hypothetical protein